VMLEEITKPGVLEHVRAIEARSQEVFGRLLDRFDAVGAVRSVGALTAVEFVTDRDSKQRDTQLQDRVAQEMFNRGLVADSSTTSLNIQPSLITPLEVIDQAADIVADSIRAAMAQPRSGDAER
jgi:4-aminobutyrate aminotransferase-like enzyme